MRRKIETLLSSYLHTPDWFKSPKYVSDIRPWLCDLPAEDLRGTLQIGGLLTLPQVNRLTETATLHGKERHNREMLSEYVCYVWS